MRFLSEDRTRGLMLLPGGETGTPGLWLCRHTHDGRCKPADALTMRANQMAMRSAVPDCPWSQGATEEEALENIRDAIQAYLETVEELTRNKESRFVEAG